MKTPSHDDRKLAAALLKELFRRKGGTMFPNRFKPNPRRTTGRASFDGLSANA